MVEWINAQDNPPSVTHKNRYVDWSELYYVVYKIGKRKPLTTIGRYYVDKQPSVYIDDEDDKYWLDESAEDQYRINVLYYHSLPNLPVELL